MVKKQHASKEAVKPKAMGGGGKERLGHSMDEKHRGKGAAGGMRDKGTVRRLMMYKQRPVRDAKGKVLKMDLQSRELPSTRIVPDRRWFGNTRVIGQAQLQQFREDVGAKVTDTYSVLLKQKQLPLALLGDSKDKGEGSNKARRAHLLGISPFGSTFGKNKTRKKPTLSVEDYASMVAQAEEGVDRYVETQAAATLVRGKDTDALVVSDGSRAAKREDIFMKGQSKRIWGELYKVVDSSDVVIQVLDSRDPQGTRCRHLEKHMKKNHRHKHMILLMNKCDLVPAWVTKRWLHTLSREYPTLAFHASQTGAFGKGALLSVLRQLARLKGDKSGISVGFVGYPNVGKSSVINTLRAKKVCKTAPVPGETKIWQYITLTKKINLIDCPGVVYYRNSDTDSSVVLKGVTRVGNLIDATEHIADVLARVKPQYLTRAYKLKTWDGVDDFLEQVARICGKLGKGGEPDVNTAAKMVLLDWQRGKIPYFEMPPDLPGPNPNAAPELPVGDPDDPIFSKAQSVLMQAAAAALELQRKRRVPVVRGLYSEEDAREEEQEGLEEDKDDVADAGAEEEGDDDEDDDSMEPEEEKEARAMDVSPAAAAKGKGKGKGKSDARFDSDEDEEAGAGEGADDSGDESDGYGDEGLSWEAVMQSMGTAVVDTAPATEGKGKGKASKTKAEIKAKAKAEPQPKAATKEASAAPKSTKAKPARKVEEPKTGAKAEHKSAKAKAGAKSEEPKTAKRKAATMPPKVVSVEGSRGKRVKRS